MISRRRTAVLILFVPLTLGAQSSDKPLAVTPTATAVSAPVARGSHHESICDGSEIRGAKHRATFGVVLMGASLPVSLTGMYMTKNSRGHPEGPVATGIAVGAGLAVLGYAVVASAVPRESFWQRAIGRMRPGETTTEDVRECLSTPVAQTASDTLEEWTYLTSRFSRRVKSVSLTFRDSVLVGVRRAEVDAALLDHTDDHATSPVVIPVVVPPVIPPPPG